MAWVYFIQNPKQFNKIYILIVYLLYFLNILLGVWYFSLVCCIENFFLHLLFLPYFLSFKKTGPAISKEQENMDGKINSKINEGKKMGEVQILMNK